MGIFLYFPLAPWAVPQMPSGFRRGRGVWRPGAQSFPELHCLNMSVFTDQAPLPLPEIPGAKLGMRKCKFFSAEPRVCLSRGCGTRRLGRENRASVLSWWWAVIYPLREITLTFFRTYSIITFTERNWLLRTTKNNTLNMGVTIPVLPTFPLCVCSLLKHFKDRQCLWSKVHYSNIKG